MDDGASSDAEDKRAKMTEVYIYSISQYYLLLHKFKSLWLYIFIQICDWFLNEFNRFIINIRLDCALNCQNLFIC